MTLSTVSTVYPKFIEPTVLGEERVFVTWSFDHGVPWQFLSIAAGRLLVRGRLRVIFTMDLANYSFEGETNAI